MIDAAARNLRTAERFLLAPPLVATFGDSNVAICDISARGARFRHDRPLETGVKAVLSMSVDERPSRVALEAMIVWSQPDSTAPGRFMSGVRTYGPEEAMGSVITELQKTNRTNRIEELRSTERFLVHPLLAATFGGRAVVIEDLSARGARIVSSAQPARDSAAVLGFSLPDAGVDLAVTGKVVWTAMKAITGTSTRSYRSGLFINERPELLRLAIGQLCESGRASLDAQSLRLKLKIIKARARQLAPGFAAIEAAGIPAEQYLLIQGVREELRLNPEEAMHWYRRARLVINDPATRSVAPVIADHPDALAVWEYLDRSVDATIVGRAFELPSVL
jgi:Tfp pilus assembly protein PilZ